VVAVVDPLILVIVVALAAVVAVRLLGPEVLALLGKVTTVVTVRVMMAHRVAAVAVLAQAVRMARVMVEVMVATVCPHLLLAPR
jgi:hypothetical protein